MVASAAQWMNDCPFQDYLFIYHTSDSSDGGMEHAFGTAINLPVSDFEKDLGPFIAITTHEFFHLWNVKRIRPQSLEPVDYAKENYTPALWFSEGVDTTAAEYIELRAGLLDERHYLDQLGQQITELQNRPAHLTQSAEQSSLDAWLEKYARYGFRDRSISYYNKGELVGVLLDLVMRNASQDQASLRELFRSMNDQYAKNGEFFADSTAVRETAEKLSRASLRDFFQKYVSGVEEIPWDKFFASVGLRVNRLQAVFADPGFEAVQKFDQPPVVMQVQAQSAADRAGLRAQDEILQINGDPAGRNFEKHMANLAPGGILNLIVRRAGAQYQLHWKLGGREQTIFQIMDLPEVTAKQKLFNVPILGKAMRMASLVPVNRGDRDAGVSAVRNATQVVKQGIHMTIFVEGHRSFDGKLLPFKKGPFYLAQECHVPVVPVTISGSHIIMPKGRFAMKGGTVTLIFHQPIEPEEFGTREALMEKVRAVISSGLPPEYQS